VKFKHYPASAFLTEKTFNRLIACVESDPEFENDLRTYYRRDWRVRVLRFLHTPSVRHIERSTLETVEKVEGLRELGKPGLFV
jgi:hypothetical protein